MFRVRNLIEIAKTTLEKISFNIFVPIFKKIYCIKELIFPNLAEMSKKVVFYLCTEWLQVCCDYYSGTIKLHSVKF